MLAISKYVSLSSIISTAYCPLATLLMSLVVDEYTVGRSFLYMLLSIPMAAIVIWMHRSNIQRLIDGNENKFSFHHIEISRD
jgi:glycerol-3-phosphate acyltransferase PlsY